MPIALIGIMADVQQSYYIAVSSMHPPQEFFHFPMMGYIMLPGSYNKVYCRCGKRNCWCYGEVEGKKDKDKDKPAHPFRRITWMEKGVSKTKTIPEKDVDWIKQVTENYRKFRKKRKEIQKLQENIRRLLEDYRMHIVKKTRRLKEYL